MSIVVRTSIEVSFEVDFNVEEHKLEKFGNNVAKNEGHAISDQPRQITFAPVSSIETSIDNPNTEDW